MQHGVVRHQDRQYPLNYILAVKSYVAALIFVGSFYFYKIYMECGLYCLNILLFQSSSMRRLARVTQPLSSSTKRSSSSKALTKLLVDS